MKNVLMKFGKESIKLFAKPYFVFLLCLVLLVLPLLLRGFIVSGEEFYLYNRISSINEFDSLSYGGRDNLYNVGNSFVFINNYFLSIILGVSSLLLFYGILKKFNVDLNVRLMSCFILAISPPFLYLFGSFRELTISVFLILLGMYLFIDKKYYSFLVFAVLPFFSFLSSIVLLILLFIYSLKFKRIKDFFIVFALIAIVLSFLYIPILREQGLPEKVNFVKDNIIFDFGGVYGLSIFIVLLMFFGLSYLWRKKYKNLDFYILLFVFIILLFFSFKFIFYFNFLLAFLGALGINWIVKREWESNLVKNLTLLFFIFGLLFSCFSFIVNEVNTEPSEDLIKSLEFLRNKEGVVLSHYKYGIFINSIANKENVLDDSFLYAPDVSERYEDVEFLFQTRDLDKVLEIFDKYEIKYILITDEMKNGLVWNKKQEGLLFLLNNNPKVFNQVYDDNIEIWEII